MSRPPGVVWTSASFGRAYAASGAGAGDEIRTDDADGGGRFRVQKIQRQDYHTAQLPQVQSKTVQRPETAHRPEPQKNGKKVSLFLASRKDWSEDHPDLTAGSAAHL